MISENQLDKTIKTLVFSHLMSMKTVNPVRIKKTNEVIEQCNQIIRDFVIFSITDFSGEITEKHVCYSDLKENDFNRKLIDTFIANLEHECMDENFDFYDTVIKQGCTTVEPYSYKG